MRKRLISVRVSLPVFLILVVIFTASSVFFFSYDSMISTMNDDLVTRLRDTVELSTISLNADVHSKVFPKENIDGPSWGIITDYIAQSDEDKKNNINRNEIEKYIEQQQNSLEYKKIRSELQKIRDNGTGIRFAYTLKRITSGQYIYIVDAEETENLKHELGTLYKDNLEEIFSSHIKTWVNPNVQNDKRGSWLSAYSQFFTSDGTMEGILCISVSAGRIEQRKSVIIIRVLRITILIIIVSSIFGILVTHSINKPLALLTKDMMEIKEFRLDNRLIIDTYFKEIEKMQDSEKSMKNGLRSFKKYIPEDLVRMLIKNNTEAVLGGSVRDITVFFSDIADFTKISENIPSERIADYLKEYFEGMTKIIIECNGTIDKYIGDAIMAFWNAPEDLENHQYYGALAAIKCQKFLYDLNERLKENGEYPLYTRIGINSGSAVVGNFGYDERLNYTAFGDTVNLASRVEGLNKYYRTKTIITENTYNFVKDKFLVRKLDKVAVKGKTEPVLLYELISAKQNKNGTLEKIANYFSSAVDLYFDRKWEEAIKMFSSILKVWPTDYVSNMMKERCEKFIKSPPDENWNGVTIMARK